MSYRRGPTPSRGARHSRIVFLLSMIALVASLMTPLLTLTAADAAAQGVPPNCDQGFVVDEATNTCVPDQGTATETATATEEATEVATEETAQDNSYLQIDKFDCPFGTDWSQATYGDLINGCTPSGNPVTMQITPPNGQPEQQTFTGTLQLGPYPAGQFAITEQVNPGYWTPWVACDGYLPNEQPQPSTASRSDTVTWPVAQDESLYCQYFNVPIGGSVTVYKWQCAEGTETGREQDYYEGNLPDQETGPCESEHLNIPITLTDAAGPHATTTQANGTQWSPVLPDANGNFQIAVQEPEGFGDPMVFCGTLDQPTQTPTPAAGAQINLTAPPQETWTIQCNWYDIPAQANSITIYKWLCEPGTQYGQDMTYYQEGPNGDPGPCEQEHLNIPISLIDGAPDSPHQTTTQANGTEFDDVVLDGNGSFQVTVTEPDDFGDPMVFCGTLDEDTQSPVTATGGTITITPASQPFTYQCNWYNLPGTTTTTSTTGTIVIEKYWCDSVPTFVQAPTRTDMQGICQADPSTGANFSLTGPAAAPQTWPDQQPSGPAPQAINWSDLPEGEYTITENGLGADWTAMIFCHASNGQQDGAAESPSMMGRSITQTLQPGYTIDCAWFNIPGQVTTITVHKYTCDSAPASAQTLADWQQACPTEGNDFTFTLTDSADTATDMTTSGGQAIWSDVPEGTFTLAETLESGWSEPVVWCGFTAYANGAVVDAFPQQVTTSGGSFQAEIPYPGTSYFCYWFNIPSTENSITIYKWQCVEGTEYGQSMAYYQGEGQDQGPCETEHLNIPISLIDGGPQRDTTTQANGTEFDNVVLNGNGSFQVHIEEPDGYGTPAVFCATLDEDTMSPVTATGGTITLTPASQPFTYQCNWYDIPGEGNSITVYKWQCEPGTEYGREQDYYTGNLPDQDTGPCETEHLNVPITLTDAGGDHATTTQANGTEWDNVALNNGSFVITIDEPDGYGEPMVFCASIDTDTQAPVTATNGAFTITPGSEPFTWQCNVYDIPTTGYQLDLYKYTCAYTVDRSLGLPDLGSNPDCTPAQGISFTASFGATPGSAYYTDPNGQISWTGVDGGPWTLTESMTPGYDVPKVFCGAPQSAETPETPVTNLSVSGTLNDTTPHIVCFWFNFEQPTTNGRITVYKYQCPPGTTSTDYGVLQETCTTPHNGIDFTLEGNGTSQSASTISGTADWMNLDNGTYTVTEEILPGYSAPLVWCGNVMQDGVEIDPANYEFTSRPVTNGAIELSIDNTPQWIVCYWYNFPTGPGEITIYKWTCPAGYDLGAWDADPTKDCTQATNGVTFTLDQPMGVDLQTDTGDSIQGAVYFGGLDPGAYTVTETVPANTAYVFVLDCTGTDIPKVHQYPLSWGSKLDINVAGGDKIVCQWYNVPAQQKGTVTVTKYVCTTKTFVNKVYCQIYEKGQSIELVQVSGNVSKGVGITNAGGTYTWNNLDPGSYTVKEQGAVPCKMTASMVDGKGNAAVLAGKTTMINVYNCTSTPGKVPPGKVPTKYPNTGVPPESASALSVSRLQGEATGTPSAEDEEFYQVDCLNGEAGTATPPASTPETEATAPPIEAEPTETPAAEVTGTPASTPTADEGGCERGAIPQHLTVESAGIDADVEYLEIVDGLMEQPTGPDKVAWYKDTARLGETNNVVIAGHLNWWNVPEGVFFHLQDMHEGDRIEVTGDDGQVYVYEVRSVAQESNLEPPGVDVIGPTDEPTLTLITCGGEWNADIAEYDHRTVVRAVQVDVHAADTASGG